MFLPYSSDIYEEYPPWMGHFIFIVVMLVSLGLCLREEFIWNLHGILLGSGALAFDIAPVFFVIYFLCSMMFWWVFGKSVCSKTGNFTYLLILSLIGGIYLVYFLTLNYFENPRIWFLSWMISYTAGLYLVFWPVNEIDCVILIPPWRVISACGFWIVLCWLIVDAVFCAIFEWYRALLIHPVSFLLGIFVATFLIRIRGAINPRDESSLWDILFRRGQSEESWKYSWKERKSHTQQEQERQEFLDEQFKKKLASSKQFSKSSSNEMNVIFLCDCAQVIVLDEFQDGQETFCPSCGKKLHQGHRQK
jgi:hypothetical protein